MANWSPDKIPSKPQKSILLQKNMTSEPQEFKFPNLPNFPEWVEFVTMLEWMQLQKEILSSDGKIKIRQW
jgi:hypothetical protein